STVTAPWRCSRISMVVARVSWIVLRGSWFVVAVLCPVHESRTTNHEPRLPSRRLRHRQGDGERAALILLRHHGDVAAVQADHLAGQRQAQAGALDLADPRVFGPVELLEETGPVLLADADARVADGELQLGLRGVDVDGHAA